MTAFLDFVARYRKLLGILGTLMATPALTTFALNVGPPWPARGAVTAFTAVGILSILLWTYVFWQKQPKEKVAEWRERLHGLFRLTLVIFFVFLGFYILMDLMLVYNAPSSAHQEAKGLLLLPSVEKVLTDNPEISGQQLVKEAEYNPFAIWKEWTVYIVRGLLLVIWLLMFWSLTFACSAFLHLFP